MKIQIIGLPCSGKTTAIKKFLKQNKNVSYLDIRDYNSNTKKFKTDIIKKNGNLIAESACGVNIFDTEIVRLEIPIRTLNKRSLLRDKEFDDDYMSLLTTQMIPAKYTVRDEKALIELLRKLFKGT